ncbi:NIF3-like protein 1 isoform X4 [Pogonomyrmex barbatus]|uniref:NIF3-like protein 1 n=1 Tax=Pogonomyrmex barbatus TaxID=144034 RepID=A0A6I9WH74_9HYME|nr:NIF3-like protein 1 isoform X4 [Pogonomyrmex barbatus]XP_011642033.1 NIF3-like protein 1 isoform X4 [Pogonomyrmex barbatus]
MLKRLYNVGLSCEKFYFQHKYIKQYKVIHTINRNMNTTIETKGLLVKDIVTAINKFADTSLAASWDNVGLLIEPTEPNVVSRILLTNDLTEDVMDEAIKLKTNLIVTYHPLIFAPLKSITNRSWKERIIARCLKNDIAVFSPHTSFDAIRGGVNDWLAETFKLKNSEIIQPNESDATYGFGRLCTLENRITVDEAVNLVKQRTNLKHVRLARARNTDGYINTVAVCAGAGTSVLKGTFADLYLTGEMLHHDVLDAIHLGIHVILTNHSDSERGFLKVLAPMLEHQFQNLVEVRVSESDKDPLQTI